MEIELKVQGRVLKRADIEWIKERITTNPHWSCRRLAKELCDQWQWRDGRGRNKDFAARSLLLKLEAQGYISLPAIRVEHRSKRATPDLPHWQEPPAWAASFKQIGPVQLHLVEAGTELAQRFAFYLHRYHYLGLHVVGENLGYLAQDGLGRDVACLLFGAAAWRCEPRDRVLGWTDQARGQNLHRLANNTRFLILPWVRVPHLASHLLGRAARRINADWQAKYAHGLDWLETFVERERFLGTCYRAANWRCVGSTQGRGRQDSKHTGAVPIKDIYLYKLGGHL